MQKIGFLLKCKTVTLSLNDLLKFSGKTKLTCNEAMRVAAEIATKEDYLVIKFNHDHPPRYYGECDSTTTVVMANTAKINIPKGLIHVSGDLIKARFAKLKPDYLKILESNLKLRAA